MKNIALIGGGISSLSFAKNLYKNLNIQNVDSSSYPKIDIY